MATLSNYCESGAVLRDGDLIYYDKLDDAIAAHEAAQRSAA